MQQQTDGLGAPPSPSGSSPSSQPGLLPSWAQGQAAEGGKPAATSSATANGGESKPSSVMSLFERGFFPVKAAAEPGPSDTPVVKRDPASDPARGSGGGGSGGGGGGGGSSLLDMMRAKGLIGAGARDGSPPPSAPAPATDGDAPAGPSMKHTRAISVAVKRPAPASFSHPVSPVMATISSFEDLVAALEVDRLTTELSAEKRQTFQTDCEHLRKRVRRTRRGLINPRSRYVQYWDLTTAMALAFTATITPFEVCLGLETALNPLFFINLVVNLIFILDIVAQFFLPYRDYSEGSTGELVRSHKKIARHYLGSWFVIDVVTVLPFDLITVVAPALFAVDCGASSQPLLKGVKLLRVLRLVKLVRMLRGMRILQRWEASISISTSMRSMITAVTLFCVLLHWIGCLWALLPQLQTALRETPGLAEALHARLATDPTCEACLCGDDPLTTPACASECVTPCEADEISKLLGLNPVAVFNAQPWTCRAVQAGLLYPDFAARPFSTWLASLQFAMLQFLGGYGPIGPTNDAEAAIGLCGILVGTIVYAGVQGMIIRVLTTGNPDEMLFRQSLDALNYMMRDQHLPHDVRLRVRDYFRRQKEFQKRKGYVELIEASLSRRLQGELHFLISKSVFNSVWWLEQCDADFLPPSAGAPGALSTSPTD